MRPIEFYNTLLDQGFKFGLTGTDAVLVESAEYEDDGGQIIISGSAGTSFLQALNKVKAVSKQKISFFMCMGL